YDLFAIGGEIEGVVLLALRTFRFRGDLEDRIVVFYRVRASLRTGENAEIALCDIQLPHATEIGLGAGGRCCCLSGRGWGRSCGRARSCPLLFFKNDLLIGLT